MKLLIILFSLTATVLFGQEAFHEPSKLIQYVKVAHFGELILTVKSDPELQRNDSPQSISLKLKDKTFDVPPKALAFLKNIKMHIWKFASEVDLDGKPKMYLRTESRVVVEESKKTKNVYTLAFNSKGFEMLTLTEKEDGNIKSFKILFEN